MRRETGEPGRLALVVQAVSRRTELPSTYRLRKWCKAALLRDLQVTLRLVDRAEARRLNRDFRQRDYAANVLTFCYDEMQADIILCAPVVEVEARAQGKSLMDHYAHLTVHGVLHAQGFDHEIEQDALVMERRETKILQTLGIADPYA